MGVRCIVAGMGPNFFIWIAMAVAAVSTIPAWYGHYGIASAGWTIAIVLAVANKVRAIRRRRSEKLRAFD